MVLSCRKSCFRTQVNAGWFDRPSGITGGKDTAIQSCLWASQGEASTVFTGTKKPRSQRVPKTSLRLALQEVGASTSRPRRNWHQVWPRATSRTCWQQKPAQVRPMPSHTYSISTRKNCRPDTVPEKKKYRPCSTSLYVRSLHTFYLWIHLIQCIYSGWSVKGHVNIQEEFIAFATKSVEL